ncbi:uncharacterized protein LOC122389850 [Amphibalanus amphitrite]|uniref:uncharacterized protein LOC122389850 n=1 Tax=Amphibalanus amphitrite TaxID=1232801 RepID=UPI001C906E90|nr:uncharacterized protein LOC122389850 [Amphibalanus amphitrite]
MVRAVCAALLLVALSVQCCCQSVRAESERLTRGAGFLQAPSIQHSRESSAPWSSHLTVRYHTQSCRTDTHAISELKVSHEGTGSDQFRELVGSNNYEINRAFELSVQRSRRPQYRPRHGIRSHRLKRAVRWERSRADGPLQDKSGAAQRSGRGQSGPGDAQRPHPTPSEGAAVSPRAGCDCSVLSLLGLATSGAALGALGAALVQQLASGGTGRSQQATPLAALVPHRLRAALRVALVDPDRLLSVTCGAAGRLAEAARSPVSLPRPAAGGRSMLEECDCYGGMLGSLAGFAALAGAIAFAATAAVLATTTTTTTAAPAGAGGRAASLFGKETGWDVPSDWLAAVARTSGGGGDPRHGRGRSCPAQLLCRGLQSLDEALPNGGLQARLASLPASWLLALLTSGGDGAATLTAQFATYCRVLVASSEAARGGDCRRRRVCLLRTVTLTDP